MNSVLDTSFSALEAKLSALLASITSSPTAAGAPAATLALLEADDALSSALQTLRTHQSNYARVLRLRAEAQGLEDRIRGIVRDIGGIGDEISAARNEGDGSDSEDSDDSESEDGSEDGRMAIDGEGSRSSRPGHKAPKEIDYKLLLDFARRISKYNVQAAADAAAGIGNKSSRHAEAADGEKQSKDPGLAAVTQEATSWLDQNANMTRDASLLPYPTEDRIRMGLMGQLLAAAVEKGGDVEKEVDSLMQPAGGATGTSGVGEGTGEGAGDVPAAATAGVPPEPGQAPFAAGGTGPSGTTGQQPSSGPAPEPKPKAKFDLDLYDPDDDDI